MGYKKRIGNLGKIVRVETKFIDKDTKKTRKVVIVKEYKGKIGVAKLKSIKKFDSKGNNADPHLVEINQERYGLTKRTGVDNQVFERNRITKKPLSLNDKKVFDETNSTILGSHDWSRVQDHINKKKDKH